jgi:ubiquitin-conjugating enzyme E2 T
MTAPPRRFLRVQQELKRMSQDPPHGIGMWSVSDNLDTLEAQIEGPEDSPFAAGEFRLQISIPQNYPNAPPIIKFVTPIYHPNIDGSGRICLDSLKPDPQGSWKPSLNLALVLTQIRLLMGEPNIADPLVKEIAEEYRESKESYLEKARNETAKLHRIEPSDSSDSSDEGEI